MNQLFRMSLFLVARAGLCLAVAPWIVGQWWLVAVSSPLRVGFSVASEGSALHQGMSYPWAIQVLPLGEFVEEESWVYEEPPQKMPFRGLTRVTLSVLFYLLVKFTYRKHPRDRP